MTYETDETTPQANSPQTSIKPKKNWLLPLGLLVVLLIIVGVAVFNRGMFTQDSVATVNGEKITREEFNTRLEQAKEVYAAQGVDTSDEEAMTELENAVLDEMINQKLLFSHATEAGITASQEELDDEYQKIVDQIGGEEALNTELEKEGLTEESLRENIKQGIVIRKFVEQRMGEEAKNVSDEEINDLYEQYVAFQEQSEQEAAPLEEVREDLSENIRQQKIQEFATNLIEELKAESEIETNLSK